jgi:putative phosphoesterase
VRIAVLADTHLPRGRRRLAGEVLRRVREADLVLHAGDFTAASVLEELERMAPVAAVHGNMDDLELRQRLPERRIVEVAAVRVGMIHDAGPAAGRHERLVPAFPGCHAIVYGHTHVPEISVHGTVLILNPGSPTERRRAPTHTMAMLEIAGRRMAPELVEL